MEITTENLSELNTVAFQILKKADKRKIILFKGVMGAGKTTLIKEICYQLGVEENVSSPTFAIINAYQGSEGEVFHFDAYRIESEEEAFDIGVEEYLFSGNWCLIEWPEKIKSFFPMSSDVLEVEIELEMDKRTYKFD
ncbi:MAG: tRNA (adenosine(37)-N6)-threonylcarbamoyltransferase complex ATPase subunit type 1 TsaE [Flavobacteriales bacterium]|nr:tRNA (adenosine(37)-N6)-threonylcarbamoyltransferase complex ATPase subunit type 1 TsaE [Flavobacteriales bacterium]MBO73564.1 tRNA (adenosine(37)-N6)-threonylcarbamoyltransferase complex ATPase subunit type 1 TsaE [Flavobacteriales bacterium]|tara:strand:+ start:1768 stop:2181 length:414 start_codon:yes stop_codon:yes gene_type:complete